MDALEKLNQNDLSGAIETAKQAVTSRPTDHDGRSLLAQLFCFDGDWQRADKQLEILGQQNADLLVGVGLLRQLVRAEISRQQFYQDGRVPELVAEPDEMLDLHLKAMIAVGEGNNDEAVRMLEQVNGLAPQLSGHVNGNPFVGVRNLDDIASHYLEALTTNGKFYWIPIAQIEKIEFRQPDSLQDQLWRSANIEIRDSFSGEVYIPTRYPNRGTKMSDDLKLGRATDWTDQPHAPVCGLGQMMFSFGDAALAIMELETIEFDR